MSVQVSPFFDQDTYSYSYLLVDPASKTSAIVDPVLNYNAAAGRASTSGADQILTAIEAQGLNVAWILDTHVHADHLSAASYLRSKTGAQVAIGAFVTEVQRHFSSALNFESAFCSDGSQFDRLLHDGDSLPLGELQVQVLHTPGHTPACVSYLCDDAVFVGDTLFMPDYGTARTDFPGGNAEVLFDSIHRLLQLPDTTRMFVCHDYGTAQRKTFACETSVAEQRSNNVHIHADVQCSEYVEQRRCRDQQLSAPKLLYPAVQFNIRGASPPPAEINGQQYFKIPITMV